MTLVVGKSAHQILLQFDGRVYKQTPYGVDWRILPTGDYIGVGFCLKKKISVLKKGHVPNLNAKISVEKRSRG